MTASVEIMLPTFATLQFCPPLERFLNMQDVAKQVHNTILNVWISQHTEQKI